MWRFLSAFVSPKRFYQRTQSWQTIALVLGVSFLLLGSSWGLFFAPADYQQGDAYRIIYIHVPAAFLSMSLYAFMGMLSLSVLVWRVKLSGIMLRATAPIGASMALIALVTGSLWGKPMWGAWWIWDARLTSEFVLLLLYIAILVMNESYLQTASADKLIAILTLVGVIDLPIIHYSVYWWHTLHQGSTLTVFAKPQIHTSMLYPLCIMLLGFMFFAAYLVLSKTRQMLIFREKRTRWVHELVDAGEL